MTAAAPSGTALRFLLAAWAIDDPACTVAQSNWIAYGVSHARWVPTLAAYKELAPALLAWGQERGLTEQCILRVVEDAYGDAYEA